jgi:hypothetical protein
MPVQEGSNNTHARTKGAKRGYNLVKKLEAQPSVAHLSSCFEET